MMTIRDPSDRAVGGFALFELGFRPFFLLAGIMAVMLVSYWILAYASDQPVLTYYDPVMWHSHEMIFGYTWLVAGFVLKALSSAGMVSPMLAVHAFTTAGIGTMTLGMMARVSLGHTGRTLDIKQAMTMAFLLINLAGFSRVFAPVLVPEWYSGFIVLAGFLWMMAFVTYIAGYAHVLVKPRIDGLRG